MAYRKARLFVLLPSKAVCAQTNLSYSSRIDAFLLRMSRIMTISLVVLWLKVRLPMVESLNQKNVPIFLLPFLGNLLTFFYLDGLINYICCIFARK